jgi:2-polyprenyl-6-methoxyphenol hydroxylase-like FAD-dependent oxidoreductase
VTSVEHAASSSRRGTDRFEVVVVGGGPVGHALAIELGRRGVHCALVERRHEPQQIPKGQNLTQRTMEHFARWGSAGELRARRTLPEGYPLGGIVAYRDLMNEYWHAPAGREAVAAYFSQAIERLPQYETEAVLRERVRDCATVTTMYGHVVCSIEQSTRGVRVGVVSVERPSEAQVLEADYVVGCDGARSIVREQAGIDRQSGSLRQRMVLAVFSSTELHRALSRFPECTTYRAMHPDLHGYWRFFGRVDVGSTWFFHAPTAGRTEARDILGILHEAAGVPFACEFSYLGFWDLRVDVARQYRRERALVAGDAAHSHPPYGGYGLNTGLEDAVNLAWKLEAVLRGWGGDRLLETYSLERQPIFEETGRDVITAGIEHDRAFLERYDPERDRAAFEAAWPQMAVANTGPLWYEPHYEGSPVVDGPPGGRCSVVGEHRLDARAGHHLGPCRLSDGTNAFDALGDGFTLLAFGAPEVVAAFEDDARRLGVPFRVLFDPAEGPRRQYGAELVLVRPDQYVAWTGGGERCDTRRVLEAAVGAGWRGFARRGARTEAIAAAQASPGA